MVIAMKLPNGENAVVDLEKLTGYCLNPEHPRGRYKARVFSAALGLTAEHAELLREALLQAAASQESTPTDFDSYGQRYLVDFTMQGPGGTARIRSSWIIRTGEDFPRLTSSYVM